MDGFSVNDDMGDDAVDKWIKAVDQYTAYMRSARRSEGTVALRRQHLRTLARENPRRSPWKVTPDDLIEYMANQATWSANYMASVRSTICLFYKWAHMTGKARHNPAEYLPVISTPRRVPKPTPDEVFVVAFETTTQRNQIILACGAYAGMRRFEIARLRWDWVETRHVRIVGKGEHERLVPLHPELRRVLDAERDRRKAGEYGTGWRYRPEDDGGFVFPGRRYGHVTPRAIGQAANKAFDGKWATHSTRHRFGTRALAYSRDLAAVQELMGHASPTTTRGYTLVANDALQDVVEHI